MTHDVLVMLQCAITFVSPRIHQEITNGKTSSMADNSIHFSAVSQRCYIVYMILYMQLIVLINHTRAQDFKFENVSIFANNTFSRDFLSNESDIEFGAENMTTATGTATGTGPNDTENVGTLPNDTKLDNLDATSLQKTITSTDASKTTEAPFGTPSPVPANAGVLIWTFLVFILQSLTQ